MMNWFSRQPSTVTPRVRVPSASEDTFRIGRVGGIAAVGFLLGVLWPRLVGWQLVPRAPIDEIARPEPSSSAQLAAAEIPSAKLPGVALSKPVAAPLPTAVAPEDRISISKPNVTSCEDKEKHKVDACDTPEFDALALPRLRALATCEASKGQRGVLSVGFDLDFGKGKLRKIRRGKSTSFDKRTSGALIACLKHEFENVGLTGVSHKHPTYTLFYKVELGKDIVAKEDAEQSVQPATGNATVAWNTAIIRKEASKGSAIVARLASGTRVIVTGRKGDWYRVKFDTKGHEGWAYKGAIGL